MKVVICGAGIAGLALANRISTHGGEVVLIERSAEPRSQGYMIDFFGPGFDAAEAMGLVGAIDDVAYSIEEVSLVDERGRRRASVPYDQFAKAVGGRLRSVMRPDLERVLRDSLPADVDLRFGAALAGIEDHGDGVVAKLAGGAEISADLLVGADGIHSEVRQLTMGDESQYLRYLGFHTAAFVVDAPEIRAATAGRFVLTDSIGSEMGFYTLRDGRVAVFAVHRTPDPTPPADIRTMMRESYGGLGWMVPEALRRCPPSDQIYYDQVAQVEVPRWSQGRVTLLGDAAYAVSLLAGQGASLAVAGAYVLAEQLRGAPAIAGALADYERLWRPVAEAKQKAGRAAARWFLPDTVLQRGMRRATLRLARLPVVNRYVGNTLAGKPTTLLSDLHPAPASS